MDHASGIANTPGLGVYPSGSSGLPLRLSASQPLPLIRQMILDTHTPNHHPYPCFSRVIPQHLCLGSRYPFFLYQ